MDSPAVAPFATYAILNMVKLGFRFFLSGRGSSGPGRLRSLRIGKVCFTGLVRFGEKFVKILQRNLSAC